jgi:hypothetical protein
MVIRCCGFIIRRRSISSRREGLMLLEGGVYEKELTPDFCL